MKIEEESRLAEVEILRTRLVGALVLSSAGCSAECDEGLYGLDDILICDPRLSR